MTLTLFRCAFIFGLLLVTPKAFSDDVSPRLFYSYESNGGDSIYGIGTGITFKNAETNFGYQLNTSLNNANILATDGYREDFLAWQGSVKFGYFSDVFIYGEVGIDLGELLFHDLRYDHDGYHSDYYYDLDTNSGSYEYEDNIDAFFGIGAGLNSGPLRLEAFVRLREIDGKYWEARSENFSGLQISINF